MYDFKMKEACNTKLRNLIKIRKTLYLVFFSNKIIRKSTRQRLKKKNFVFNAELQNLFRLVKTNSSTNINFI